MERSLRGQFLLAAPSLGDPNFEHAVVLLIGHTDEGVTGVILNAPLDVTVADALGENVESAATIDVALHRGGPCRGPMMVLHDDESIEGDAVLPGVRFTTDRTAIERLMATADAGTRIRYIIGYAGWGVEQLEREFEEGSWLTLPATPADTFGEADGMWERLSTRATLGRFIRPEDIPRDPNLN